MWDDLGWIIAKGVVTQQEAGAALDSMLLELFPADAAVTENNVSRPLQRAIKCALKSARGSAAAGDEGHVTFTVRVVRPEEAPSDRQRDKQGDGTVLRRPATAAYTALDGIDDLSGVSPRIGGSGSSWPSSSAAASRGSGSGELSSTLGDDLLGDRSKATDSPLDESWSSAEERHEVSLTEGGNEQSNLAVTSPHTSVKHAEATATADDETIGKARVQADRDKEADLPTLSKARVDETSGEPAGVIEGDDNSSEEAVGEAFASFQRVFAPSSSCREDDMAKQPVRSTDVADSGYSDDDFDDEDDGDGDGDEDSRSTIAPSLFTFSGASSTCSLEDEFDDDGSPGRDEARKAHQHKRDEIIASAVAVRLRRRLLRAIVKRCGGGNSGGSEGFRAGAALLFDRLDQVMAESRWQEI